MSRAIVVIREPLRSMLTPAGLKALEAQAAKIEESAGEFMREKMCDAIGIDLALCCDDDSCPACQREAAERRADDDDRAYDREMDRRAGL